MNNTDEFISLISQKILEFSGIYLAKTQIPTLCNFIEKRAAERNKTPSLFCKELMPYTSDFDDIINLVTVNETYFFREERQFDILKNEVFPKFMGKDMVIWSCCCATGEEPISLLALALSMNINLTIYASDIDDNALSRLEDGRYSLYSLRSDGKKYHNYLEPFSKLMEKEIIFNESFLKRINHFKFNLIKDSVLPFTEEPDIIFMRNVFIYFDNETRKQVTAKVSERLKDNGLLFFSMNEIGSIDKEIIPKDLYKTSSSGVYYFVKDKTQNLIKKDEEADAQKKRIEKIRMQVEKARKGNDTSVQNNTATETKTSTENVCLDIKKIYEEICTHINRSDFTKARTIARSITGSENKKYSFFLQGYIEYHDDNKAAAESLFASAQTLSSDFWPAYFYHGLVLRDIGKDENARKCFCKCREILSDSKNRNTYNFTLDSFSPAYIYSICENLGGEK